MSFKAIKQKKNQNNNDHTPGDAARKTAAAVNSEFKNWYCALTRKKSRNHSPDFTSS